MATYTSAASGLFSAGSTWVGGVKPPSGGNHQVIIANGHNVTYDEAAGVYGDDTTNGFLIQLGGTLSFSRTVSTQLTVRGDLKCLGGFECGTEANPIPENVTVKVFLNDSATLVNGKWGFYALSTSAPINFIRIWGHDKQPQTTTVNGTNVGDTSFEVENATGWKIGDIIHTCLNNVDGVYSTTNKVHNITSITPTTGTAAVIGISGSLQNGGASGRRVVNLTRNIQFRSVSTTARSFFGIHLHQNNAANCVEIGPAEFCTGGHSTPTIQFAGSLNISTNQSASKTQLYRKIYRPVVHGIYSVTGNTASIYNQTGWSGIIFNVFGGYGAYIPIEEITVVADSSQVVSIYNGTAPTFIRPKFYGINFLNSGYSQGSAGTTVIDGLFHNVYRPIAQGSGVSVFYNGVQTFENIQTLSDVNIGSLGEVVVNNPQITRLLNVTTPFGFSAGQYVNMTINNPVFAQTITILPNSISNMAPISEIKLYNINNDPTRHYRLTFAGHVQRSNTVFAHSNSSIELEPFYNGSTLTMPTKFYAAAGETCVVKGSIRYNSNYSNNTPTHTPPSVTISGLGMVPVSFTAPNNQPDVWHPYTLTITNTNSYGGNFDVVMSATPVTTGTGPEVFFAGIPLFPYVDTVRHYGYMFDALVKRTVDTRIVSDASAAAAFPVVIDHVLQTITPSASVTSRQVFEKCMYDLCTTGVDKAIHITSPDGETFTTSYTVVNPELVSGVYVDSVGRHITISAPNILPDSRVQVYNTTDSIEIANFVTTGTGFSLSVIDPGGETTIRLRVSKVGYLPITSSVVINANSAVFVDTQVVDNVYVQNGIDGSTITEFTPDYPNLQIDVDDADGFTTVQRIYAWTRWANTTADGIRLMHNSVQATDDRNYLIDVSVVNAKFDNNGLLPLVIRGGRITRSDGTSIIGEGQIQVDPGPSYVSTDIESLVNDIAKLHGLLVGTPLVVSDTTRTAGNISQTITTAAGVTTVTRTA